ncbi:MAG: hypothetical protein DPW09_01520 [Anaerolineae bacterium]|nr:hypothetical protein [Anaerolineae bacterium]
MRYLRGLHVQILLWTILPLILILIAVSLGSITLHQQSMRDMVAERNAHLASLAAARLNDRLRTYTIALETVLKNTAGSADISQALTHVEPVIDLFDRRIALYDVTNAPLMQVPAELLSVEPEVRQILASAQAASGQTVYRPVPVASNAYLLLIALTDRTTKRSVVGAISQKELNNPDLFEHINRNPQREFYLIASDGRIISHHNEEEIGRDYTIHDGVLQALRGEAGATFEHLEGEEEHVVGYAPIPATGWALLVEEPWAHVIVPGLQYTLWAPILVLIAAIASLTALHFGLGRIVHPLQVLGREASRMAWGDFQTIEKPVGGIVEIRDLQSTLQEMAGQIHRYQDSMRDYIAALTQTQEEERRRLARELHDVIVQSVIALIQRIKMLQLDWQDNCGDGARPDTNNIDQTLNELAQMAEQCLKDVRGVIRDLRPVYLEELGLVSALEDLVRSTGNGNLGVTIDVTGDEVHLSSEANMALYRVAQAAVTNAIRHGQPDSIALLLEFGKEGVVLTVEDNGTGFIPPERPSDLALHGHFGLVGMHERAIRLGGHLSIRSTPGTGTKIAVFLPYTLRDVKE